MDNNNPTQTPPPIPPAAPVPTPVVPTPSAAPVQPQATPTAAPAAGDNLTPTVTEVKSNGKMKWILIGLVVLLLAGGGYYYYTNFMSAPVATTETAPVSTAPKTDNVAGLQTELDAITVTAVEGDFTQLDQDLSTL